MVFGRVPAQKARSRRSKREVQVLYFRSLFEAEEAESNEVLPAEQPVQLAMFAW